MVWELMILVKAMDYFRKREFLSFYLAQNLPIMLILKGIRTIDIMRIIIDNKVFIPRIYNYKQNNGDILNL